MATLRQTFADIADAIRAKGVSGTFKPIDMASKIGEIQAGGSQDYGYLTFTAEEATTLTLKQSGIAPHKLLKSTDAVTWTKWENPSTNGISLNAGQSVYIKADEDAMTRTAINEYDRNRFSSTGRIACSGSVMSIVKIVAPGNYTYWFNGLFSSCTTLTTPPELAATVVDYCYYDMFNDCKSLTTAPELPALAMANYCYRSMFAGCTSLTTAPELPAMAMFGSCYSQMFSGCTSLKRIKMNASSGNWGTNMFYGCTSLELVDMTGSTGVPTLSNTSNFQNTNNTYKIVVPDSLYDTWIAATNWASIASHIMKQSDWNAAHPDDQL